jgi:hypothetical protein
MNTVELLQSSLGFAWEIFAAVTADLTQEQADWRPPGVTNTIGSIYSHILTYVDYFIRNYCREGKPLPVSVESAPRVLFLQDVQEELSALHERAKEVRALTEGYFASLTPADLDVERETTVGPLKVGPMLEVYIIWHINAHCGEIAALKGCQGAKGYPW